MPLHRCQNAVSLAHPAGFHAVTLQVPAQDPSEDGVVIDDEDPADDASMLLSSADQLVGVGRPGRRAWNTAARRQARRRRSAHQLVLLRAVVAELTDQSRSAVETSSSPPTRSRPATTSIMSPPGDATSPSWAPPEPAPKGVCCPAQGCSAWISCSVLFSGILSSASALVAALALAEAQQAATNAEAWWVAAGHP